MKKALFFVLGLLIGSLAAIYIPKACYQFSSESKDFIEIDSVDLMDSAQHSAWLREQMKGVMGDYTFEQSESIMRRISLENHNIDISIIDHWDSLSDEEKVYAIEKYSTYENILLKRKYDSGLYKWDDQKEFESFNE